MLYPRQLSILLDRSHGLSIAYLTRERSWKGRALSPLRSRLRRCSGFTPSAYEDSNTVELV